MRHSPRLIALLSGALLFAPSALRSQAAPTEKRTERLTVQDYLDWEDVQDPQLSPDGKQIVFTRRWIDKMNDKWESSLWIMNADGTRARFLVNGSAPKWSPDGGRIAYTATPPAAGPAPVGAPAAAAAPAAQIFVRWMDAEGAVTQLTHLMETPNNIEWSPDSKWLAFSMQVPAKNDWHIDMPTPPKGAKWTEAPRIVQKLNYRADRQGFIEDGNTHIFVLSADNGGTPRQITSGAFNHGAPRWMPDGKSIVFSGLRMADAEYQWRESDIYRVDVASGNIVQLTTRKGPDGNPTPSPDGKWIAYTGYDSTSDTWTDAKLYLMTADGKDHKILLPKWDRTPSDLTWTKDGSGIYFNAEDSGARNLYLATMSGDVKPVTSGRQVLTVTSINPNGSAVGVMTTSSHPSDVVAFSVHSASNIKWLTDVNDDVLSGKKLATTEEIWYTSKDGMKIQGWIVKPADFDPSKKYPLILDIHGGPHAMYNLGFSFVRQDQASNGYVSLYT
ncbi:MAG: S9 family peptidase, partial [bacterium]